METNPRINVVVFEIKRLWKKENLVEGVPTLASDGIQAAWRAAQSKSGARPAQVLNIYSEWEPSEEDEEFIANTFPNAEVSYSFARPTDGDWEQVGRPDTRLLSSRHKRPAFNRRPNNSSTIKLLVCERTLLHFNRIYSRKEARSIK